jgi:hypothetical protein
VAIGYYDGETGAPTGVPAFENVRQGLSVAQVARLGTRDGLNLEIRNTFVLGTVEEYTGGCYYNEQGEYVCEDEVLVDTYKEFRWGSTTGTLTAPVARVTDLLVTVGGGSTGYFNVMGGMQSWMRGNGDAPSLGISVAAGYGMIAGSPTEDTYLELRGPLVSVGLRSRW